MIQRAGAKAGSGRVTEGRETGGRIWRRGKLSGSGQVTPQQGPTQEKGQDSLWAKELGAACATELTEGAGVLGGEPGSWRRPGQSPQQGREFREGCVAEGPCPKMGRRGQ